MDAFFRGLDEAENKKRNSDAWKNFTPADGIVTEFVPIVIGWFGEFGPAFQGFIDRVGSHFGDRSGIVNGNNKDNVAHARRNASQYSLFLSLPPPPSPLAYP